MATRVSQPPVAGSTAASATPVERSYLASGTFAPKQVWGVFTPIRSLELSGDQFVANLRAGEVLKGRFELTENKPQDTLTLQSAERTLSFEVVDITLGRNNELTAIKLLDPAAKAQPFSLFSKQTA